MRCRPRPIPDDLPRGLLISHDLPRSPQVHERSMESDFLLMVIRDLLHRRPELKLVLMSATLDVDLFAK